MMKMKKFIALFFIMLVSETAIEVVRLFFHNTFLNWVNTAISLPLVLLDRSYPFYAEGSTFFGLTLFIINVLLQTITIYFLIKTLMPLENPNSNNSLK